MRQQFTDEFKAKVALEALRGNKTISELTTEYGAHPTQISAWKATIKDRLPELFSKTVVGTDQIKKQKDLIEELYKSVGKMQVENDWLKKKLNC